MWAHIVISPDQSANLWPIALVATVVIGMIIVVIQNWRGNRRQHRRWREEQAAKAGLPVSALPRTKGGRHLRKPG
jgi:hypothetical protein